jgi:hypothetical protein
MNLNTGHLGGTNGLLFPVLCFVMTQFNIGLLVCYVRISIGFLHTASVRDFPQTPQALLNFNLLISFT